MGTQTKTPEAWIRANAAIATLTKVSTVGPPTNRSSSSSGDEPPTK